MTNDEQHNKHVHVNIKDTQVPLFSNSVQISVSNEEVAFQFLYIRRNTNQGVLQSEIILTPQHAIAFQKALDETIQKHFTKHLSS